MVFLKVIVNAFALLADFLVTQTCFSVNFEVTSLPFTSLRRSQVRFVCKPVPLLNSNGEILRDDIVYIQAYNRREHLSSTLLTYVLYNWYFVTFHIHIISL